MTPKAAATPADIDLIEPLTALIVDAAAAILAVAVSALAPQRKADDSPVTVADEAAQSVILAGLARLLPDMPVISEESSERALAAAAPAFILVDPLDGTRDFLAGRDEYTVNIALVRHGTPVLGLVAAPALGLVWRGAVDAGAERLHVMSGETVAIRTRPWPACAVATVSRSHLDPATEAFVARLGEVSALSCGSSVKFCRIAEGGADVYPRLGPTSEWDVAAGHAVLVAAGGLVETPDRAPLAYGRNAPNFRIPAFIAWGDPQAPVRL